MNTNFTINYDHLAKVMSAKLKWEFILGKPLKPKLAISIKTITPNGKER